MADAVPPAQTAGVPGRARSDVAMGTLAGIARHRVPKGAMETLDQVAVTLSGGLDGDFRGTIKPGGRGQRQVTLIERADWDAATAEIGRTIPWFERRANLLIEGLDLPKIPGTKLRIGPDVVLSITRETDPCSRMDALAPGLQAALRPDWRGGACTHVVVGGMIRVGDPVALIEE